MATPAQINANQSNARHSTGPRTAEGKAASSKNATKHGLSAAFSVLAHEDQADFNELLEDVHSEHKPGTAHQVFLVDQLAKTWWILCRAQRLEAKALDYLASVEPDSDDPDSVIVAKLCQTNPNGLLTLQRYGAQAEKSYYKAWRELKAAKQIQNEAEFVSSMARAQTAVLHRVMQGPVPTHPAYGADPLENQYGYLPQNSDATEAVRAAARAGEAAGM